MTDERLAAAQFDKNAANALNSEIARLREHHFQIFDSFSAAHPEAEHLVSVIQAYHDADADLTLTPPDRTWVKRLARQCNVAIALVGSPTIW